MNDAVCEENSFYHKAFDNFRFTKTVEQFQKNSNRQKKELEYSAQNIENINNSKSNYTKFSSKILLEKKHGKLPTPKKF